MTTFVGRVRASSWPALFDCALRFEFQTLLGLWRPPTVPQRMGSAWHAASAAFDRGRMDGAPITVSDACGVYVDALHDKSEPVDWDMSKRDAEVIGIGITQRYCEQIAPHRRYAAVELKCDDLNVETPHGIITLTGTTDAIRIDPNNDRGITDRKSGKRAVEHTSTTPRAVTKGHHLQLGVYQLMAEHMTGGEPMKAPAEIIGANTSSKTRPVVAIGRILAADVRTPLIGTPERPGLLTIAAGMLKSGVFPPNPRSQLCSEKYCAGWGVCPYRSRDMDDNDNEPDFVP